MKNIKRFTSYELGKKFYQEGKRISQSPYLRNRQFVVHQGWFEKGFNDAKSNNVKNKMSETA